MDRSLFALAVALSGCVREPVDATIPAPVSDTPAPVDDPIVDDPIVDDPTTLPVICTPPALLVLEDIPDAPSMKDADGSILAAFEVDGDQLVGKVVRDAAVARGALVLWQELVLRIPLNQRAQLVQFSIFQGSQELLGWVDNTGIDNLTGRYGTSLYLQASNVETNNPDVCAPLSGHRGTYDWNLIHEFAHLRQYSDGSGDDFGLRFDTPSGNGQGYPADGYPSLDGDFVTEYAEVFGPVEDAAESFTAYVMLDPLPTETSLAAEKVRFFASPPGYEELRLALRVTEPGGGSTSVPDAPLESYDLEIDNPSWLWGTWEGDGPNGPVEYVIEEHELVFRATVDGVTTEVVYSHLRDDGTMVRVDVVESSDDFHFYQVTTAAESYSETFSLQGDTVEVNKEHFGVVDLHLVSGI